MRHTGRNPWDVLGVAEGAPFSDVKRAYLRCARQTHPDTPGGSAEAFREVQAAFEAIRRCPSPAPGRARPTPYDRWTGSPPLGGRQWVDDDPLTRPAPRVARRPTFAELLSSELGRCSHAA